jgi:hypothetical protein
MSFTTRATIFHGFDRGTHRWNVAIEADTKMSEKEWEAFVRDLDNFLREKYPKLRLAGPDKP